MHIGDWLSNPARDLAVTIVLLFIWGVVSTLVDALFLGCSLGTGAKIGCSQWLLPRITSQQCETIKNFIERFGSLPPWLSSPAPQLGWADVYGEYQPSAGPVFSFVFIWSWHLMLLSFVFLSQEIAEISSGILNFNKELRGALCSDPQLFFYPPLL